MFAFRRSPLDFLNELARRYGDVAFFKIARKRFYLVNRPDYIRDVLVTHADQFHKGPALRSAKQMLGEGLLTSEGEAHRRQRRLAQPAFHPRGVAGYAPAMTRLAAALDERWGREVGAGAAIDVHAQMMHLTLLIAAETMFGADVAREAEVIGQAMDVSVKRFVRAMSPFTRWLDWLPLPGNFRFKRARRQIFRTVDGFIRRRRAARQRPADASAGAPRPGEPRDDLLSLLLRAQDSEGDGGGMSDQLLRDQAITLFTAGHETTANALTFTWYLLAKHPDAARRLRAELLDVLGRGDAARAATADDLPRLPYARAVLAESMRLYPPAWAVARSVLEDYRMGPYLLPKGSVLLMSQFVTHRDERFWPEAQKFDPTRWLGAGGKERTDASEAAEPQTAGRPRYAYYPFAGGPRGCIGESFAWMEATLVLAALAARWRMELIDPRPPALLPTITLRPKFGIKLALRRWPDGE